MPRYSEEKFALDPKLYTLPGLNGGLYSFAAVTKWLWQYVKTYKLQVRVSRSELESVGMAT